MSQKKFETLSEYDFSKGARGKYAKQFAEGKNVIILSPDVAEFFPDSDSVNEALRLLIEIAGLRKKKNGKLNLQDFFSRYNYDLSDLVFNRDEIYER